MSKTNHRLIVSVSAGVLLVLLTIGLASQVRVRGVCCYDDAAFAATAKNLAAGRGYTLPFHFEEADFTASRFDPLIGVGPVSILPVAAAIGLFGPQYWVPGAVQLSFELLLTAGIVVLLTRTIGFNRALFYAANVWLVVILLSSQYLEQWFAQLGESIAALLVAFSYFAWNERESNSCTAALSGLCLGLAVMAKEMAGLYVLTFACLVVIRRLQHRGAQPLELAEWKHASIFVLCGVLPFVLFELWRLQALGLSHFARNWHEHFEFIRRSSLRHYNFRHLLPSVVKRSDVVSASFFLGVPSAAVLSCISLYVTRQSSAVLFRTTTMFVSGIVLNLVHWLLTSSGRPRYLYIAIVLWCFVIAMPLLCRWSLSSLLPYLVVMIIVGARAVPRHPFLQTMPAMLAGTLPEANESEKKTISFCEQELRGQRIYSTSWQHIAALIYFDDRSDRFDAISYAKLSSEGELAWVVLNRQLISIQPDDAELASAIAQCGEPVFSAAPYLIYRCHKL